MERYHTIATITVLPYGIIITLSNNFEYKLRNLQIIKDTYTLDRLAEKTWMDKGNLKYLEKLFQEIRDRNVY